MMSMIHDMANKEPGYVNILTNPSFREDWVKIGKYLYIIIFLFPIVLSSCSSTLEERAKKQMKITLANEFKYADEFDISKENVIYNKDSVFIMLFHMKGKKDNGKTIEGDLEYAYEESSMWAYGHPEVIVWDDYFEELTPFGKNSVEKYLENMKDMNKDGKSYAFKTPYNIVRSVLFSMKRKVPSEFSQKVDEYKKDNKNQK